MADYRDELANTLAGFRAKRGLGDVQLGARDYDGLQADYSGLKSDLDGFLKSTNTDMGDGVPSRSSFVKTGTRNESRLASVERSIDTPFSTFKTSSEGRASFQAPTLEYDQAGYQKSVFNWMKSQSKYAGFSDDELRDLAGIKATGNDEQLAGKEFWYNQQHSWDKANADTMQDRNNMLAELSQYRAQTLLSNQMFEKVMAEEEQRELSNNSQTLTRITQQYAQMGRSVSPLVLSGVAQRLTLASRDKLFVKRAQLEMDRAQLQQDYLSRMYQVLGETKRSVIDPATAVGIMEKLGQASSDVASVQSSGGGGSVSLGGGSGPAADGKAVYKQNDMKPLTDLNPLISK